MNIAKQIANKVGGQMALARICGVTQATVWAWTQKGAIPPVSVLPIVRHLGGAMTPYQIRPDIYPDPDWLPPDMRAPI